MPYENRRKNVHVNSHNNPQTSLWGQEVVFLRRHPVANLLLEWHVTVAIWEILLACKLNIFDDVTHPDSTSNWKQTLKTVKCTNLMSTTKHYYFPWTTIFLFKITLFIIKGTALSPALIWPVCIKTTRATIDQMWFLSMFCWNSHKEHLDWLFSPPFRAQKLRHTSVICPHLYQLLLLSPWGFHCVLRYLLAIFQENYLCSFPGKTAMNHTTHQGFSHGLLLASEVNPNSSRLSGNRQSPNMPPSSMKFQSKS